MLEGARIWDGKETCIAIILFFWDKPLGINAVRGCFDYITFCWASGLLLEGLEVSRESPATLIIHTQLFIFISDIK